MENKMKFLKYIFSLSLLLFFFLLPIPPAATFKLNELKSPRILFRFHGSSEGK